MAKVSPDMPKALLLIKKQDNKLHKEEEQDSARNNSSLETNRIEIDFKAMGMEPVSNYPNHATAVSLKEPPELLFMNLKMVLKNKQATEKTYIKNIIEDRLNAKMIADNKINCKAILEKINVIHQIELECATFQGQGGIVLANEIALLYLEEYLEYREKLAIAKRDKLLLDSKSKNLFEILDVPENFVFDAEQVKQAMQNSIKKGIELMNSFKVVSEMVQKIQDLSAKLPPNSAAVGDGVRRHIEQYQTTLEFHVNNIRLNNNYDLNNKSIHSYEKIKTEIKSANSKCCVIL